MSNEIFKEPEKAKNEEPKTVKLDVTVRVKGLKNEAS